MKNGERWWWSKRRRRAYYLATGLRGIVRGLPRNIGGPKFPTEVRIQRQIELLVRVINGSEQNL